MAPSISIVYCFFFFILVFPLEEMERNLQHSKGVFTGVGYECCVKATGDQC